MASARGGAAALRSPDPARSPGSVRSDVPGLAALRGAWRRAHRLPEGVATVGSPFQKRSPSSFVLTFHVRQMPSFSTAGSSVRGAPPAPPTRNSPVIVAKGAHSVSDHRLSRFRKASGNPLSQSARSRDLPQFAASRSGTFNAMPSLWPCGTLRLDHGCFGAPGAGACRIYYVRYIEENFMGKLDGKNRPDHRW